ncbi:MAG: class I SAM-dependent methyltransferase [Candidatus Methylomirabilis oxyfera]|nr:class I SAM-dependent methyltransferase [Candidatus Methylomirabilis oxyfera]
MERSLVSPLVWGDDGCLHLGDLRFRIQPFGLGPITPDQAECVDGRTFVLYRDRWTLEQYAAFLPRLPAFDPKRIFEIGIWAGGSAVLLSELFRPAKLVAIDLKRMDQIGPANVRNLEYYITAREMGDRLKLFWETDQGDVKRLRDIVRRECGGVLDLVIDDGSHVYRLTKQSFEALFPFVHLGGWYVVEDWSWDLQPGFESWVHTPPLSPLITSIVELAGSAPGVVKSVLVSHGLTFIQRGEAPLDETFQIERHIHHHRTRSASVRHVLSYPRRLLSRFRSGIRAFYASRIPRARGREQ